MGERHFALLGEVEEDPAVFDTAELQANLETALLRINEDHKDFLRASFVSGTGFPEFIGVLHTQTPIYRIARSLAESCYPLGIHLAMAAGEITTGLDTRDAEAMEGPAYDAAGELLYRARKEDRLLLVDTGNPSSDELFNALMLLLNQTFQSWTERQWEVVRLYRRFGRQSEVAAELSISQQSVSSTLAGAGWRVLADVEQAVDRVLAGHPARDLIGDPG